MAPHTTIDRETGEVTERIRGGVCAPYAWADVMLEHERNCNSMSGPDLRDRAADVRDVNAEHRALADARALCLAGEGGFPCLEPGGGVAALRRVRGLS